jgi:hypothetical protein
MPMNWQQGCQSAFTNAENDMENRNGLDDNSTDLPVENNEKATIELENETEIETKNGGKPDIRETAISTPTVTGDVLVETDHSEKDQSDDSQPNNALKKTTTNASDKPYSIFTPWQKRFIILAASTGSFISPLTSNIYFPALNTIASDLHVSISQVNLTITTYMVRDPP